MYLYSRSDGLCPSRDIEHHINQMRKTDIRVFSVRFAPRLLFYTIRGLHAIFCFVLFCFHCVNISFGDGGEKIIIFPFITSRFRLRFFFSFLLAMLDWLYRYSTCAALPFEAKSVHVHCRRIHRISECFIFRWERFVNVDLQWQSGECSYLGIHPCTSFFRLKKLLVKWDRVRTLFSWIVYLSLFLTFDIEMRNQNIRRTYVQPEWKEKCGGWEWKLVASEMRLFFLELERNAEPTETEMDKNAHTHRKKKEQEKNLASFFGYKMCAQSRLDVSSGVCCFFRAIVR